MKNRFSENAFSVYSHCKHYIVANDLRRSACICVEICAGLCSLPDKPHFSDALDFLFRTRVTVHFINAAYLGQLKQ